MYVFIFTHTKKNEFIRENSYKMGRYGISMNILLINMLSLNC